jgi:hypothetical protein
MPIVQLMSQIKTMRQSQTALNASQKMLYNPFCLHCLCQGSSYIAHTRNPAKHIILLSAKNRNRNTKDEWGC